MNLTIPSKHIIATYIGNVEYEGNDNWGDYYYILIKSDLGSNLLSQLRAHPWYQLEYDPTIDTIMIVFKPDEEVAKTIFKPFSEGKYSEISRAYVNKHFTEKSIDGSRTMNWKVCNKDKSLKKYWENRIGVTLPDSAEVWSAPKKQDEIYGYEN
jgi:hypothetical protein